MRTPPIIHNFLEWVSQCYDYWPSNKNLLFFRGQSDCSWKLLPRVFRNDDKGLEKRVILDYKQVAITDMDYQPKIENMLVSMQHNGVPTRLLDWSMNPLVALFFACIQEGKESNGIVYALNPWEAYRVIKYRLKGHGQLMDILKQSRMQLAQGWSFDEIKRSINRKYDYIIEPETLRVPIPCVGRYMTSRVSTQNGSFLIWGDGDNHSYVPELHVDLTKFSEYNNALVEPFIIQSKEREDALMYLRKLNVNSFTVFPDSYGFAEGVCNAGGIFKIN